jgi:hypothetical protein
MELIVLLAIGIVIGIPTIAMIALVRSKTAGRRIEEIWYKVSDLHYDPLPHLRHTNPKRCLAGKVKDVGGALAWKVR